MTTEPEVRFVAASRDLEAGLSSLTETLAKGGHVMVQTEHGTVLCAVLSREEYESLYSDALVTRDPDRFGLRWENTPDVYEEEETDFEPVF